MTEQQPVTPTGVPLDGENPAEIIKRKQAAFWGYFLGITGIIVTILMFVAIIVFREELESLRHYGYLGAFLISILGGATIIIPVPMLAVVFALGSAMTSPLSVFFLGMSAAFGELLGALTIYMTGHGAGRAISSSAKGRMQKAYEKMLRLMERRGPLTLFIVASVINPFFYPAALAAGALRLGLRKYTVIVFAGKIIKCQTVVFLGYFGLKGILRAVGIDI